MDMMISLTCVLTSFCLMALYVPGAFADERIYDFDNEDAANAWEVIEAEWEIIDGEYVVTADPNSSKVGMAVLKESEGIDTEDVESIEFMGYDLGTGQWKNLHIVFGFDEHHPVTYGIGAHLFGAWRLMTFDSKTRIFALGTFLVQHKEGMGPRKWYHVKLEFDGDTVILYSAEGEDALEEKLRYEFPDGKPSGRIGIGGFGSNAKYDDFRVTFENPDAEPKSMTVEPKDKLSTAWGKLKTGAGS